MTTHRINAANNGLHWTIAFDSDGEVIKRGPRVSNTLYVLFECDCGAEFDSESEAIAHLRKIDSDDSGEQVKHYPTNTSAASTNRGTQL